MSGVMARYAIVLYQYIADDSSQINAEEGDQLIVLKTYDDGWSEVKHVKSGAKGRMPESYFEYTDDKEFQYYEFFKHVKSGRMPESYFEYTDDKEFQYHASVKQEIMPQTVVQKEQPTTLKEKSSFLGSLRKKKSDGKQSLFSNTPEKPLSMSIINRTTRKTTPIEHTPEKASSCPEIIQLSDLKKSKKLPREQGQKPKFSREEALKILKASLQTFLRYKFFQEYINDSEFKSSVKRIEVIKEIIATERYYVQCLTTFVEVFQEPSRNILSEEKHKAIFSNIGQILTINNVLLEDLKREWEKFPDVTAIAACIKKIAPFLIAYSTYVNNYDHAFTCLQEEKKKNVKFMNFLNSTANDPRVELQPINSFLIMPVQRLLRYKLLLEELLKNTPAQHIEIDAIQEALEMISSIAIDINERVKNNSSTPWMHPSRKINHGSFDLSTSEQALSWLQDNENLALANQTLRDENEGLRYELEELRQQITQMTKEMDALKQKALIAEEKIQHIRFILE